MENPTIVSDQTSLERMISKTVTNALAEFQKDVIQKNENEDIILSRSEAATFLSISLSTLARWTNEKLIPQYGISKTPYYKKSDLIASMVRTN